MAMEYDGHVKAQKAGQGVGLLMFLQSPWAAYSFFHLDEEPVLNAYL